MLNSGRFFALSLSHFKGKYDLMMIFFFFTVIEGEWIVIALNITDESCADGKYNESLLLNGFDEVVPTFMCLFTSSTLVKLKITFFWICNMTVLLHVCQSLFMFLVGKQCWLLIQHWEICRCMRTVVVLLNIVC